MSSGTGKPKPQPLPKKGVAEDDAQGDHAGHDQHDPADVGGDLDRRLVVAVLGHEQPDRDVHEQAGAAEEGQHGEHHPDHGGVDVEVATEAAGDTGDVAVGAAAAQPVDVTHLVAADAGTVCWRVLVSVGSAVGRPLCSVMSSIVSATALRRYRGRP